MAATVQEPTEAFIHEMREIFHINDGGVQETLPMEVLPLTNISDHLPLPLSYNINGITINAISWNIMVNETIKIYDQTKKRNMLNSIQYYIGRLLGGNNIHVLLFQEYNWNQGNNQLAPHKFLGKEGSRLDVSRWGILHSYGNFNSCGPGLLIYYKQLYLQEHKIIPYVIFDPELKRSHREGGGHLVAPYFDKDNPRGINLEKNLVLILDFEGKENILVIQNIHRRRDSTIDYTKHIFSYFGYATPGVMMPWTGRPESNPVIDFPVDKNVAVSIIGDFNYAPYAFTDVMRAAPPSIQMKLQGDYKDAYSFGNYLFNHANAIMPNGRPDDYKNIMFNDIKQLSDDNIRAVLFQATESVLLNNVQVFSDILLGSRMTQKDILYSGDSSTQGKWKTNSRQGTWRSRSMQSKWKSSKSMGMGVRRKKPRTTIKQKRKMDKKKRDKSIRRKNNKTKKIKDRPKK